MSRPQRLTYQEGGLIWIDIPELPYAATVRIVDGDDVEQMAHASVNTSTIDTTIATSNVSSGDTDFTVAANTGISTGKTMWLRDDPEEVLVRTVQGTTVKLRRPVMYDHIVGGEVHGARLELNVASAYANSLWWDGRAEWNVDGYTYISAVECTKYPMHRLASAQDLFDCEPKLYDVVDPERDVERWLDNAHQMVLGEIAKAAPDQRARVFTGSMEFKSATAAAAMYLHYVDRGGDAREAWWQEFERRLACVVATTPRDADQDGVIESDERMTLGSVRIRRA